MPADQGMRIVEFRAENFARLKAVEIRPDGALVPITGKNSQGKTSVLRAIWALIEGRAVAPAVAIREGEDESTLHGDLGAYKITRTIKRDQEGREEWSLKVVDATGARVTKKPQAVLDAFKGDIGFDPLGWCRLPPKDQADALRSLVKGFDFEAAAAERAEAFAARTTVNRRALEADAAAGKVQLPEGPEPKPVDVAAKITELQETNRTNSRLEAERRRRPQMQQVIDNLLNEVDRLRAEATALEATAKAKQDELDALPALGPPFDTDALQAEIASAQQVDAARGAFARRRQLEAEAKAAREQSASLTQEIENLDSAQHAAIAKAKLPVKGLTLGEDAVLFNGLPLAQAGTAEKIEVALAVAMAKNPDLRVILVDEGSELDADAMEFVAKLADDKGFQVWIARVDESRQVGFVIVDGRVAT